MFLTTDNKMLWGRLKIASVIVACLLVLGIAWVDGPLYLLLRKLDCNLWYWFGVIFDDKVWFIAGLMAVLVFYIKKSLVSKPKIRNDRNRISLIAFLRDFYVKIKGSYAFFIFCSIVCTGLVVKVLKTFIGRARPIFFEALDMTGFFPPSTEWAFNSMPSGHTAVTFAGLVMIGMLAPRYKVLTWTLAIIVGVSRIAIGAHWPTDVILGAFIGMVIADIVKWQLMKK